MEKKYTAVTWLRRNLNMNRQSPEVIEWLFNKALQMEQEQIERAYDDGYDIRDINGPLSDNTLPIVYFTNTYHTEP